MPRALRRSISGRWRLMPGVFTTTWPVSRAAMPPAPVASTSKPPDSSLVGWSSTSTGSVPMARKRRRLADPSLPSPNSPTRFPARSDQLRRGRVGIGHAMLAHRGEQALGRGSVSAPGAQFRRQGLKDEVLSAVRAVGGEEHRGSTLLLVADALKGLHVGPVPEQGPKAAGQRGIAQWLAAVEHHEQVVGIEEGGEDQVDK